MSKRLALVLPYFGTFNNYFPLFMRSCAANPQYDWLLVTDQEIDGAPKNVRVISESFDAFRAGIQKNFGFPISLDRPYKLCDFKPTYGLVMQDELAGYEYWGHCDCDLLFGDMALFLEPLFDKQYDKIFAAGHLTIYRNTPENASRFMKRDADGVSLYEIALSHPEGFAFDEMFYKRNVHTIFLGDGAKLYSKDLSFNVSTRYWSIRREAFDETDRSWKVGEAACYLKWEDGHLVSIDRQTGQPREWLYAHLQGRNLSLYPGALAADAIAIGPDCILPAEDASSFERHNSFNLEVLHKAYRRMKSAIVSKDPREFDPYEPYIPEEGRN
jgi:hypothetical protein